MESDQNAKEIDRPASAEPELPGTVWKHPYFLYIVGTVLLFGVGLFVAYLAIQNDWIPRR